MLRKILLLICVAFAVLCYGYPCLIMPFGSYEYTYEVAGISTTASYTFGFDGKVTQKIGDIETEAFYKLKGNKIVLSLDETFDDDDNEIAISSIYKLGNYTNKIGMYISIGVGVLALALIITIPSKR